MQVSMSGLSYRPIHDGLEALSGMLELAGTGSQKPTVHLFQIPDPVMSH